MADVALPKLSIGLPVYNGEEYLSETLDALLAQSFRDFEIIVSDNASTDRTPEICRAYASADPRVKYRPCATNIGGAANFNRCLELAQAGLFKWAAVDDLCAPDFLELCVRTHEEASVDVAVVMTRAVLARPDGTVFSEETEYLGLDDDRAWRRFAQILRRVNEANALYGVIRRDLLLSTNRHGSFPESDYVLLGELALRGRIVIVDLPRFTRRVHDDLPEVLPDLRKAREAWFKTYDSRWRGRTPIHLLVALEFAKAAWSAPLNRRQRVRCVIEVPRVYSYRKLRAWAGRVKRRIRARARGASRAVSR